MSTYPSTKDVQDKCLRAMGPDLGPIYHALSNEVTWLHAKWIQYRQLYAHSSERIELLNGVAGHFFSVVQGVLWDDVVLHLARLVDPAQMASKSNLTLFALRSVIPDPLLAGDVDGLAKAAQASCSFAKDTRNRHLAHRDLELALGKAHPLPGISRKNVEDALAGIRAVLHKLESHYWNSKTGYEHFLAHSGADALANHLRVASDAAEERMERLRHGRASPKDLEPMGES